MNDELQEPIAPEMIEKEKYLRLAADFDNYRRSMDQQMTEVARYGSRAVVLEMVRVLDLFDQAIAHAPPDAKAQTQWWQGVEQIEKQFLESMRQFGIERIAAVVGGPFDPSTMEAVQMVPASADAPPDTVAQVVGAGYRMHDRVIRPAKVAVYQSS